MRSHWAGLSINYRYETWRITHVVLAVAVTGLVLHHALVGGLYSQSTDIAMVWISFNSPFSILEHPFTIGSYQDQGPRIQFLILEAGDWTKHIGALSLGSHAYLNGPYG